MLHRRMLKLRAATRRNSVFTESVKSRHKACPEFRGVRLMAMTLVWTGVALWLAVNAGVAACLLVTQPGLVTHRPYRGPTPI